jgi:hypothetical protein
VFLRLPGEKIEVRDIDSTMIFEMEKDRIEVDMNVVAPQPGWLYCYCFPYGHEIFRPSLETLNTSDVSCKLFLR